MPEGWGRSGRRGGSSLGRQESIPPLAELGRGVGVPRFLGEVGPRRGAGEPSGWLWVLKARPQAPGTCCRTFTWTCGPGTGACPGPRSLRFSGLGSPACCSWPPAAPHLSPQRGVSCHWPTRGRRGPRGTWIFPVSPSSGAPQRKSASGWGRNDCLGASGSPCGARPRCALGVAGGREVEAASRALAAPGSPTGDTRVTGEGALACPGWGGGAGVGERSW